MSKIKDLSKITTRYSKEEGIAHPTIQKVDFRKPTVIHISKKEMEMLHNDGRLETDGGTILADE